MHLHYESVIYDRCQQVVVGVVLKINTGLLQPGSHVMRAASKW